VLNFPFSIHTFFLLLIPWPSFVMFSFLLPLFVFFCIILHSVLFFISFFHIFLCNVLVHTWTNIKKDLLMRVIWNSNLRVLWYDGNERPAPYTCAMGLKGIRRWYWKSRMAMTAGLEMYCRSPCPSQVHVTSQICYSQSHRPLVSE
jgi:hypothetical protein